MNSSWIEEAHAYNMELEADEVSSIVGEISQYFSQISIEEFLIY